MVEESTVFKQLLLYYIRPLVFGSGWFKKNSFAPQIKNDATCFLTVILYSGKIIDVIMADFYK